MFYLTGDTHGHFERIARFCEKMSTTKNDVLIILGDAGINFHGGWIDSCRKEYLSKLPITLLCIHGNHERRPQTIDSYQPKQWYGGTVLAEEEYPSILFAIDGEVYDFDGQKAIVIGGAYSIDWMFRVPGRSWWPDEQPSAEIIEKVEHSLDRLGWRVNVVLSHTVPLKHEPVEVFLPGVDQSKVDKATEKWLDTIEDRLKYDRWYCGHYHTEKCVDRIRLMFEDFTVLQTREMEAGNQC